LSALVVRCESEVKDVALRSATREQGCDSRFCGVPARGLIIFRGNPNIARLSAASKQPYPPILTPIKHLLYPLFDTR